MATDKSSWLLIKPLTIVRDTAMGTDKTLATSEFLPQPQLATNTTDTIIEYICLPIKALCI